MKWIKTDYEWGPTLAYSFVEAAKSVTIGAFGGVIATLLTADASDFAVATIFLIAVVLATFTIFMILASMGMEAVPEDAI